MASLNERLGVVGWAPFSREVTDQFWREHRDGMTQGIEATLEKCPRESTVAILGAGNCRDIDLVRLEQHENVERVDLWDLDEVAMEEATAHARERLRAVVGELKVRPVVTDVTGVMGEFCEWMDRRPQTQGKRVLRWEKFGAAQRQEWLRGVVEFWRRVSERSDPGLPTEQRYDTVVSDCILSQLQVSVEHQIERQLEQVLGEVPGNPSARVVQNQVAFWTTVKDKVAEGVVKAHFKKLRGMVKPGGQLLVASDQFTLKRYHVGKREWASAPAEVRNALRVLSENEGSVVLEERRLHPRFTWKAGNLAEMAREALPDFEQRDAREWVWNRQPWELIELNQVWEAEKVQALRLRAPA